MTPRVLEEFTVFTPLGLRFRDPALGRGIADGLRVSAWPARGPRRAVTATRTRTDVYTFRWLPGLRALEHVLPDAGFFGASPPGQRPFVVSVEDTAERFLPVAFEVGLPLPYRGVFLARGDEGSPPAAAQGVHLFSAPTRRTSERLTAVRGTLADADTQAPAAWALVRIDAPHGAVFRGMADAEGRFSVVFPWPSLEEGFSGSPPAISTGTPMGERGWDIEVRVFHEPGRLTALPGTRIPEYRSVLEQRQGSLWSTSPGPGGMPVGTLALRLPFGEELVLRSAGSSLQFVSAAPASP